MDDIEEMASMLDGYLVGRRDLEAAAAHLRAQAERIRELERKNAEILKTLSDAIDCIEDVAAMPVSAAVASFRSTLEKLNHAQEQRHER